jgi:RNA polymerase sigma factor (TIGR02999 family)
MHGRVVEAANPAFVEVLHRVSRGESAESLVPVLYRELKRLAHAMLAGQPPGMTLQTTDLVHEAYLKLIGDHDPGWNGRAHFFGAAARAMREILVDQARSKGRAKRGGGLQRVIASDARFQVEPPEEDVVALNEALQRLASLDPRKGEIVNLRYFAGLSSEEAAGVLGISARTLRREWRFARSWLYAELHG